MADGFEAFPGQQSEREAAKSEGESPGLQLLDSRIMAQDSAEGDTDFESPDPNMTAVGDFRAVRGDVDAAYRQHQERSERARDVDNQNRAPITTDFSKWKRAPDRYDYPGVDTPTQDPKAKPKDYKAGDPRTTEVDEESEVATGRQSRGPDLMREIGGERVYSEEVVDEGPSGAIPGVAPSDFVEGENPDSFRMDETMGAIPSAEKAPRGWISNLAEEAPERALEQPNDPVEETKPFGEQLMDTREERGNLAANAMFWERRVEEFEEEDMSVEFEEVTSIAGQTVVELGDFFEGDEGSVDAAVTGLAERGAPVKGVEGTDRIRIDVSDEDRPIPFRERERSISGRFVEEL